MSRECLFLLLMFNVSTHRIHYPWCNGHISCRLVDREPYLSMTLALHGLNLVELDLGIKADSFHTTTKEAYAFYASLPSLHTLSLHFWYFPPETSARSDAAKIVYTFLSTCPALNSLLLETTDQDGQGSTHTSSQSA